MTEKWIVDDAGTLINMETRENYDYMEEVVDLLNDFTSKNEELNNENEQLKEENKQLKQSYQVLADMCDEYLSSKYLLENENESLKKENKQLTEEKEFWKGDSCNCSNYLSILSMDCQIVQEAICDLKNVIDVDTEAFRLLDELDDKFDELNQHRIKMYSR